MITASQRQLYERYLDRIAGGAIKHGFSKEERKEAFALNRGKLLAGSRIIYDCACMQLVYRIHPEEAPEASSTVEKWMVTPLFVEGEDYELDIDYSQRVSWMHSRNA